MVQTTTFFFIIWECPNNNLKPYIYLKQIKELNLTNTQNPKSQIKVASTCIIYINMHNHLNYEKEHKKWR